MSLTKKELIAQVADETGYSRKDTELMLDTVAGVLSGALTKGDDFVLPGVGKFSTSQRAARTGRNPRTGEPVAIGASTSVKFSAAKALKDAVQA